MADETVDETTANAEETTSDWETALAEQQSNAEVGGGPQSADFKELGDGTTAQEGSRNLNFLLDIPLNVTVELGRTNMLINKMLHLTQGSVVELDKVAGEPVEIYINNKLLGKGEVVVVNDRFGVRITEIISQADRIKNIG
jgi:flagellar motor switch protein FliN/FliY